MSSTQHSVDKERAERQQLNEALAESRTKATAAGIAPKGARCPKLVQALRQRKARTGVSFYDEYVQAVDEEQSVNAQQRHTHDAVDMSVEADEQRPYHRPHIAAETPVSSERSTVDGRPDHIEAAAPRARPRPRRAEVLPAVIAPDLSVFSLMSEQIDDLRRQKRELQAVIDQQDQKICELIGLIQQLLSQPEEKIDRLHMHRETRDAHGSEEEDR